MERTGRFPRDRPRVTSASGKRRIPGWCQDEAPDQRSRHHLAHLAGHSDDRTIRSMMKSGLPFTCSTFGRCIRRGRPGRRARRCRAASRWRSGCPAHDGTAAQPGNQGIRQQHEGEQPPADAGPARQGQGLVENPVIASSAKWIIFPKGYLVCPANLGARSRTGGPAGNRSN